MREKTLTDRTIYYDYLRVFATIAVIMLHTAAENWYGADVNGEDWFVFNFYDSIVRWGVPVFVMISGALFLKKEIPLKVIYSKYVFRMFVSFIAWSFIYYIGVINPKHNLFCLFLPGKSEGIAAIASSHYHLWFIPMIAGMYICIPIIKKIAEDEKTANYFLIVSFVFWFLLPQIKQLIADFGNGTFNAVVNAIYQNIDNMNMGLVCNFVFYFILGYKLTQCTFKARRRIMIYICGLLGFAFTIIIDLMVAIKTQTPTGTYYKYSSINVLFEAIAVFVLFKHISFKKNLWYEKVMVTLSRWSFGAYLVHVLVLETLNYYGISTLRGNPVVATPFVALIVFVVSFGISGVLNNVPIVKKYIV